jgi:VWFA-related protein
MAGQGGGPQPRRESQTTFRATTELVTTDVVVTDKQGISVRDLRSDDFEVKIAGRVSPVKHVLYVRSIPDQRSAEAATSATREPVTPPGTTATTDVDASNPPGRTIALVVDDLGLSWESVATVRRALREFVDDLVQPGDLVGVIRTGGGLGPLQQLTRDKRLLLAAIERVQWTAASRSGVSAFSPVWNPNMPEPAGPNPEETGDIRNVFYALGSLGALDFIVQGLESLQGRKAVVFLSEGIDLFKDRSGGGQLWDAFVRLLDRANKAGIVVYTIDPRGLATGGLTAEDNPQPKASPVFPRADSNGAQQRDEILAAQRRRMEYLRNTQDALRALAWETGGLAIQDTNDLNHGLRRVVEDLSGYYLIGYERPPGTTIETAFSSTSVRVKRPDVKVRWRRGAFGPSAGSSYRPRKAEDALLMAALSPIHRGAIAARLTVAVEPTHEARIHLRSTLFVDCRSLSFTLGGNGRRQAALEIVEVLVGDNGTLAAIERRTLTLSFDNDQYRRAIDEGIVYNLPLSPTEIGPYQLRVAVKDVANGAMASLSLYVDQAKDLNAPR